MTARQRAALSGEAAVEERVFAFSHDMFAHANEYRGVFRAMAGTQSETVVRRLLHRLIVDLVRDDVKATTRSGTSAVVIDAVAQFVAGGLLGLLIWWLNGRPRLSVAEVDALFRKLARPALRAMARSGALDMAIG